MGAVPVRQQVDILSPNVTNYSFDQFAGLAAFDHMAVLGERLVRAHGERGGRAGGPLLAPERSEEGAMGRYLIRRVLFMILVLFIVSLLTFLIFVKLPAGDPARRAVGRSTTPEQIESGARGVRPGQADVRAVRAVRARARAHGPGWFLDEDVYYSYGNFVR